jgi:uncharacterized protein YabN with tetrapyrrole methylase and pyrophosphatase domain
MAKEQGTFSLDDVLDRLSDKLVDRHPHVFGEVKADTAADVKRNWEALKVEERKKRGGESGKTSARRSLLAGISSAMPAMLEASKLSSRAAQAGFDWPSIDGVFEKLDEETKELREHLRESPEPLHPQGRGVASSGRQTLPEDLRERAEEEIGDLFFVVVNLARYLSVDPESALRRTNRKFKRRFQWMEDQLNKSGRTPEQASMEELESLWQGAKQQEQDAR